MIKIEALTLEEAYQNAASSLECSVTELKIEVVQAPSKGFLGLFKKSAIIVAIREVNTDTSSNEEKDADLNKRKAFEPRDLEDSSKEFTAKKSEDLSKKVNSDTSKKEKKVTEVKEKKSFPKTKQEHKAKVQEPKKEKVKKEPKKEKKKDSQNILNDTIMPASFVSTQDDEEEYDVSSYLADYDDEEDDLTKESISDIAVSVKKEINKLFDLTCFKIDSIDVSVFDENTLLVEFKGEDAALLIGKEGYRYKALSYMIFNWINTKYQIQLRLEIAEFLKNQEEAISKYLVGVCESINRDGRAQTKILDGVLVQIALKELRERYPDKYIVIRSTRDGLKYIIINDYHSN